MRIDYHQNLLPGGYYHIYNRTVAREPAFIQKSQIENFSKRWNDLIVPYIYPIASCFMPNHFHYLVQIKPMEAWDMDRLIIERSKLSLELLNGKASADAFLSDQFRRVFSGYGLWYNIKHRRNGRLMGSRINKIQIYTDKWRWHRLCYIHHNCIHHNLASDYSLWPYTSYHSWMNYNWDTPLPAGCSWMGKTGVAAKENFIRHHAEFKRSWLQRQLGLEEDEDFKN